MLGCRLRVVQLAITDFVEQVGARSCVGVVRKGG